MRHNISFKAVLFAAALACACSGLTQPIGTPTSTPTPASPAPAKTPGPLPSPTPVATDAATGRYPPRPTATAYVPPEPPVGVFANADHGLQIRYPDGWTPYADESNASILTRFSAHDGQVQAILFAQPLSGDKSFDDTAAEINAAALEGLTSLKTVSDETFALADGRAARTIVSTGRTNQGQLKIGLTFTAHGAFMYILMTFATPGNYDAYDSEISALTHAFQFEPKSLYGIPRDQALVLESGESTNPREYDPATAHGSGGDALVFSGLVSFDPQLNLIPELAESWQVENGTVYTFRLRPNARFHNGRPVTAQDVIYAWERAADPQTDSDTVLTYLGDIVGVKEMRAAQAEHISGLKAVDDHTLQVTLDAPKPYFLLKLTYPTTYVVDRENVASGPEWYRTPNGTGPYRLIRWEKFKLMLYERNEDYYLTPPAIPYIVQRLYTGEGIRLYESGDIDMTGVGSYNVARVQDPKEPLHADLRTGVSLCTDFVVFDVNQPPFDDVKVRQAFSLAFDRQKYIEVELLDTALPARGLYPPALPGYNASLAGLDYNPDRARQLLAESKYGGPAGLPPITYTVGGLGTGTGSPLAQMWQQTLGLTLTIEYIDWNKYSDQIDAGRHGQIFDGGWCADYPDPENFSDALFHTGAEQNRSHYSNPQVDELLEQARVEPDVAKRLQLYQQAEQIIVKDAPVLFMTHGLSYVLVKPYVQGYVLSPISVPLARYLWIDPEKMK